AGAGAARGPPPAVGARGPAPRRGGADPGDRVQGRPRHRAAPPPPEAPAPGAPAGEVRERDRPRREGQQENGRRLHPLSLSQPGRGTRQMCGNPTRLPPVRESVQTTKTCLSRTCKTFGRPGPTGPIGEQRHKGGSWVVVAPAPP